AHTFAQDTPDARQSVAFADGLSARFAGCDDLRRLGIHEAIVDHHNRLILAFAAGNAADDPAGNTASADVGLFVVAPEAHDVASEQRIRAGNLADARTFALLDAVARVKILLLKKLIHLRALDDDDLAILGNPGDQHRANAFADVLLRAENRLNGSHDRRVIK